MTSWSWLKRPSRLLRNLWAAVFCVLGASLASAKDPAPPIPENWSVLMPYMESGMFDEAALRALEREPAFQVLEWGEHRMAQNPSQLPACAYPVSLEPGSLPDTIDVLHYDIHVLDIDMVQKSLTAQAILHIRALKNLDRFNLHLESPEVSEVKVYRGNTWESVVYDHADGAITVEEQADSGEEIRVRVSYAGQGTCTGRFKEAALVFDARGVHTFCQPTYARHWFPGVDEPHDKATLQLTIDVPPGLTASATGSLVSSDPVGDKTRIS